MTPVSLAPVPPLGGDDLLTFLLQVGLLLLLASLLGRLAVRLGMPAVVGELSVGILLGPSLLSTLSPGLIGWSSPADPARMHLLDAFGQVGLLLLVGVTGMHMDLGLVRRRAATAAGVSMGGLLIPFGLGVGTGYLLPGGFLPVGGDREVFALFLGVAMCVSAIPVIAKTLIDLNLLHRNVGQLTLTAGMIDDVFGWFMLSVVSAMATAGVRAGEVGFSLLALAGVVVGAVVLGRPAARIVFRLATRSAEPGLTPALAVVVILLCAAGTHALKLEAVFGAFVAGILVGNTGADPARLAPLRAVTLSVLAPVFFATAGLRMDLTALADLRVALGGLAVLGVAIAGKFAGAYAGARLSRLNRWEALAVGAGMNARGVIEVVVAMVGLRLGVLNTEAYTVIVLVAIVTSVMAPPILRVAMARVEQTAEERLRHKALDAFVPPFDDHSRSSA